MQPEDIRRVAREFAIRLNDDESLRARAAEAFHQSGFEEAVAAAISEIVDLRALELPERFLPADVPAFEDALFQIYERDRRRSGLVADIRAPHRKYWLGRG